MTRPLSTLLLAALVAGCEAPAARAAAPPAPSPWPLPAAARARLDRVARRQALEGVALEKVNLAGKVPAWLLTRLVLPPQEELRHAQAAHQARLHRARVAAVAPGARRSFDALVRDLPAHLRPEPFRWTLTVIESPEPFASTPGAGLVHASTALVRALQADPRRGDAALAFLLAREIAHVSLGHCRAGWQRQLLEEQARLEIVARPDVHPWSALLQTQAVRVGHLVHFLYSREQEYAADLFALHLCRNAGIDLDAALDGMRYLAVMRHPEALHRGDFRPAPARLPRLAYYLSPAADPLVRLKRLLMERDGEVEEGHGFGLFLLDRRGGALRRLRPGALRAGDRPIVFVHGLHGGLGSWDDYLDAFAQRRELLSRPLVVFHHPANGSLARGGKFLANEVADLVPPAAAPTFVCHSAGGLVFRHYAERLGGPFERAVFLGTPHAGSDLTRLQFLIDVLAFAGALRGGLPAAVAETVANGRGAMGLDLHPDSLFLRHLGRDAVRAKRYAIVYGEALDRAEALAAQVAFASALRLARTRWLPGLPEGLWRLQAERLLGSLTLPPEFLRGDGVVRSRSAVLEGVPGPIRTRQTHLRLRHDPEVMRLVLRLLHRPAGP